MRPAAGATIAVVLVTAPLGANADLAIGPGVIAATIRDARNKPVAGATVVAAGPVSRQATTGIAGIVTIVGLPIGTYDVRVTRAGFAPLGTRLNVSSDIAADVLRLKLVPASLASGVTLGNAQTIVSLADSLDPLADQVVAAQPDAQVIAVHGERDGVAPTLLGTSAGETRVELDGIPLAGESLGYGALQFRNAFGLNSVALSRGPALATTTVRDAIGGVIDYRTPDFGSTPLAALSPGYSSSFGAFQDVRAVQSFGPISIVADAVTGGGQNRTQTIKARYDLSTATSVDLASYGSQSTTTSGGIDVSSVAPAYEAGLRTTIGGAVLQAHTFGSAESTANDAAELGGTGQSARIRGVQAGIDVPSAENVFALTFDRRTESASFDDVLMPGVLEQTYTSVAARADLRLSQLSRFEIGDDYAGGTSLPRRHDPHVALTLRPNDRLTFRLSAGSAYATAPASLLLLAPSAIAPLAPETSIGFRAGIDATLDRFDRITAGVFSLRQFDRFATYANADTRGIEIGFSRAPLGAGISGDATLSFQRAQAYGPIVAASHVAEVLDAQDLVALNANPYYAAHSRLAYRTRGGIAVGVGSTLFGAQNALSAHAVGFGDAFAIVPFAHLGDVRFGENNIAGVRVADPLLEPLYAPHEFTVLLNVSPSSSQR